MKAVELIYAFDKYVRSDSNNRHNRYLTFRNKDKIIKLLGDMFWNEVEHNQEEITKRIKQYWYGRKDPSPRSIELAWRGLYYSFEFGVVKKMIPRNPFRHFLPRNPRSGSLID